MNEKISLESLLPHRKPMLLLDGIVRLGEDEILTEKTVAPDSFFLEGHYPDYPIVPGVITCECLFQSGAALLAHRMRKPGGKWTADQVPVVARIENAKFKEPIRSGDRVFFLVRIVEEVGSVVFLKGEARVGDKVKATAQFACALAPRKP